MKKSRSFPILALLLACSLLFFAIGCAGNKVIAPNERAVTHVVSEKEKPVSEVKKPVDIREEFKVGDYPLLPQELESLRWIKKSKEFTIKKLGFRETHNFTQFKEGGADFVSIWYHRKNGRFPFSEIDPLVAVVDKRCDKKQASAFAKKWWAKRGITEKEYDIWFYSPDAVASSAYVTPTFLHLDFFRMIYVVVHEMWHLQVRFPVNFEEATCVLIGEVGSSMFWHESEEKTRERIEERLGFAKAINLCHAQISELAVRLQDGKISMAEFLLKREKCIKVANESQTKCQDLNPTMVVHLHTYMHYFPLVYKLYHALDYDLIKLIQILQQMNGRDDLQKPVAFSLEEDFIKSRETEKRIEAHVENVIQKALADKNKKVINQ